jgi:hypothetical protein
MKTPDDLVGLAYRGSDGAVTCVLCDCEMEFEHCGTCGGDGVEDAHEDDPINCSPGEEMPCRECHGKGGFYFCQTTACATHFCTQSQARHPRRGERSDMSLTAYTDISFVNRWTLDSNGELVRFFGWAIAIVSDSRLMAVKQGVEKCEDERTVTMETRAISLARAAWPDAKIVSDCLSATGYDAIAEPNDPFHQIVHFASRDALYTRLVTAGHSFKGRNKTAAAKMSRAIQNSEAAITP